MNESTKINLKDFDLGAPPDELLLCIILEGGIPTYWLGYPRKIGEDNIIAWKRLPRLDKVLKREVIKDE